MTDPNAVLWLAVSFMILCLGEGWSSAKMGKKPTEADLAPFYHE